MKLIGNWYLQEKNFMAKEQDQDKNFLETIAKTIVSKPEDIKVERTVDEMGVLLTLKTAPEDMGYIIGRKGQTAQAIRTLLKIVGAKNNARVNLKIFDPNADKMDRRPKEEVDTSSVDDLKI